MADKAPAKSILQALRPFNPEIVAAGLLMDGVVGAWTYLDGHLPMDPMIYAAVSGVLKSMNLALHFISTKIAEEPDDGPANTTPGQ